MSTHYQTVQLCMAAKSVKTLMKWLVQLSEFDPLCPIKSGKPRRNALNRNVAGSVGGSILCARSVSRPTRNIWVFYYAILPSCVASEIVLLKLELVKMKNRKKIRKRNEWCWRTENWTGQRVDTRWSQMSIVATAPTRWLLHGGRSNGSVLWPQSSSGWRHQWTAPTPAGDVR